MVIKKTKNQQEIVSRQVVPMVSQENCRFCQTPPVLLQQMMYVHSISVCLGLPKFPLYCVSLRDLCPNHTKENHLFNHTCNIFTDTRTVTDTVSLNKLYSVVPPCAHWPVSVGITCFPVPHRNILHGCGVFSPSVHACNLSSRRPSRMNEHNGY